MRSYSLVFTCALTVINAPLILGLDIDLSKSGEHFKYRAMLRTNYEIEQIL